MSTVLAASYAYVVFPCLSQYSFLNISWRCRNKIAAEKIFCVNISSTREREAGRKGES